MSLEPIEAAEKGHSPWADAWGRLRRNKLAVVGGVYVIALALASCLPWLLGLSIEAQGLDVVSAPPGTQMIKIYVPTQRDPVQYTDVEHFTGSRDYVAGPEGERALAALKAGQVAQMGGKTFRPSRFWLGRISWGETSWPGFSMALESHCSSDWSPLWSLWSWVSRMAPFPAISGGPSTPS